MKQLLCSLMLCLLLIWGAFGTLGGLQFDQTARAAPDGSWSST
jgi:hypothetical protein